MKKCQPQLRSIFLFCSTFNPSPRAMSNVSNSKRDFEAGPWDEKHEESSHGIASTREEHWRIVCSINSVLSNVQQATGRLFNDSVLSLGQGAMSDASRKFTKRWLWDTCVDRRKLSKIPRLYIPAETSTHTLAVIREQVSTTGDVIEKSCSPETYPHGHDERVGGFIQFSADEVNFQNATVLGDYAGRFRQRCWILVEPCPEKTWQFDRWKIPVNREGNWDRKASQIFATQTESGHPVIQGTTIFEKGHLRPKRR